MTELSELPLFESLAESTLKEIRNQGNTVELKKGESLFEKGDPGNDIYIVLEGLIEVSIPDPLSDKDKTLALLGEKELLGEMAILTDNNRSGNAKTLDDSRLFTLAGEVFQELTQESPELALNLSRILGHRLWDTDSEMQRVAFNTVQSRLASQLLRLADKFGVSSEDGTTIDFRLTHQMLADLVGTYRETITKKISEFKRKDILGEENDRIVIQDRERLERIANV